MLDRLDDFATDEPLAIVEVLARLGEDPAVGQDVEGPFQLRREIGLQEASGVLGCSLKLVAGWLVHCVVGVRKVAFQGSRRSPHSGDPIGVQNGVRRDEVQLVNEHRCHEEPVERVPVMERQGRERLDVPGLKGVQLDAVRRQLCGEQGPERARQWQLAEAHFESDLKQADRRQPPFVRWVHEGRPGRGAELRIIGEEPEQRCARRARVSFHVLFQILERFIECLGDFDQPFGAAGVWIAWPIGIE